MRPQSRCSEYESYFNCNINTFRLLVKKLQTTKF